MPDIFSSLPRFSWRGIELPLTGRKVERAHEQVQHPLLYKDGDLVESTGAKNWTFTYNIPFRESIAKGPYRNLYTKTLLDEFVPAFSDRSAGPLHDPAYGWFVCKPLTYLSDTSVNKRDGEDITVAFVHAPEQDTAGEIENKLVNVRQLGTEGALLDEQVKQAAVKAEKDPPPPLVNPLDLATGLASQVFAQSERVAAAIDDFAFRAEKAESTLEKFEDPQNHPIVRSLRRSRAAAARLKRRLFNPARVTIEVSVLMESTPTVIAAAYGMTVADLMRLNPGMRLLTKAGSIIKVYA